MSRKILVIFLALILVVCAFSSCKKDDRSSNKGEDTASTEDTTQTEEDSGEVAETFAPETVSEEEKGWTAGWY